MHMQLNVDTSQPNDIAHLAIVSNAFNGGIKAPAANADKPKADTGKTTPAPEAKADSVERVTVEMVRTAAGTKVNAEAKAVFTKMGFEGLSKIPADRLAEALEGIKALKDK